MRPAPAGTGIIAGGPMRAVFEALGVGDVVSKSLGTSNPYNMVRATFDALKNQQSPAHGRAAPRPQRCRKSSPRREGAKAEAGRRLERTDHGRETRQPPRRQRQDRHGAPDPQRQPQARHPGATLRGLGLGKIRRTRTLEDTPSVRGMIHAVKHLVEIVEDKNVVPSRAMESNMKLNEISNNPGAHKHKHKVGRGSSSGLGKTSGRGVKGAKARTGTKVYGFEGGQMPLHMRMPKRGFNNIFAQRFLGSESRPPAEGDRRQAPRRSTARSPKRCCARPAWRTRAATACACWARASSRPRSTSKWPAPRPAPAKRSKRPAARVTTTFKKKVYMNKKGEPGKRQKRRADAAAKARPATATA